MHTTPHISLSLSCDEVNIIRIYKYTNNGEIKVLKNAFICVLAVVFIVISNKYELVCHSGEAWYFRCVARKWYAVFYVCFCVYALYNIIKTTIENLHVFPICIVH